VQAATLLVPEGMACVLLSYDLIEQHGNCFKIEAAVAKVSDS
jgi:hypothetical protein